MRRPWLLVSVVAALGVSAALTQVTEYDLAWYLRAGNTILADHALPARDPFSYTSHQPWLNHEWLAEVTLALIYRVGGFVAINAFQGACVVGATLLLALASGCALCGWAPLAFAAAGAILRELASPRGQLFSDVLFAATLVLARQPWGQGQSARWRWVALVATGLLWTQLHGGNPTGAALLGISFVCAPSLQSGLAALTATLLTCVGPYGTTVHNHFIHSKNILPEIREWQPLSHAIAHGSGAHIAFVLLVAAACVAIALRFGSRERPWFDALALLIFTALAVKFVRFASEDTLVAGAALAPALARIRIGLRSMAPVGLGVVLAGFALSHRPVGFGLDRTRFPVDAVSFLQKTRPPGPMFNSYNFGGYLLWAYPEEPVFIDGRAFTVYPASLIEALIATYEDPARFSALSDSYHFHLAVLQRHGRAAALVAWLRNRPDWRLIYEDDVAEIFVRR